ncbi:MAG: S24 family peptidase [Fimbriimonadaceae bacterium]
MPTDENAARLRQFRDSLGLTQEEMAAKLEIKRSRYANYETGLREPKRKVLQSLIALGYQPEVGPPLIPASQLLIPIPYLGFISASDPVNWTDPFESESFEYVPPEMGDVRGRFACRVASDSMYPILEPDDVCVFQKDSIPKIGTIIMFRSEDLRITIKQVTHNGTDFVLHPINNKYEDCIAQGECLGYLVGVVRERGTLRTTIYDASGIRP